MKLKSKSGAILGALIAAALVSASAATLGGLTSDSLGANDSVVAACDSDGIDIAYTYAYNATSQWYDVTDVNFSGVDPNCDGLDASISLADGTTLLNTTVSTGITVPVGGTFSITLGTAVQAELVDHAALVITGS
ncbi:MAG: hypothetical protein JWN99_2590 [Ilumatobacteraceae bacterium]|nr:hypothetical protein [Ilumatobacteraceae bacterium]